MSILDTLNNLAGTSQTPSYFYDRINRLNRMASLSNLSRNWSVDYHKLGMPVPANAFMFGFVIVDWDKSFRKRNPTLKTSDLQIPFQYVEKIPDWAKAANYQDLGSEIIGRFEPIPVYSNSASQTPSVTLIYHAEALNNIDSKTYWTLENIEKITKKLQSFVYPNYTQGYAPPYKLKFNIGNTWRNFPIVITNIVVSSEGPYHIETGIPMIRKIQVDMKSAYPMWQAISGDKVFVQTAGNDIFGYEELDNSAFKEPRGTKTNIRTSLNKFNK